MLRDAIVRSVDLDGEDYSVNVRPLEQKTADGLFNRLSGITRKLKEARKLRPMLSGLALQQSSSMVECPPVTSY